MRIVRHLSDLTPNRPSALTIGAFDGVHRGHAFLFEQLKERAREASAHTLAITFDPDPSEVVTSRPTDYLTSLDEKIALIQAAGIDELCVVHFDRDVASLTADQFIDRIRAYASLIELLVGHDFAMGHDRQGTRDVLSGYCSQHGIKFFTSEALELGGAPISASRIRRLLAEGDIEGAAELLGRQPSLSGRVVGGDRRGRDLGFPTANLELDVRRALPGDGIYVALTHVRGRSLPSAVNVGLRPTFDATGRTIESFILDFNESIYDEPITVEFLHRLRPEEKFSSVEALVEQMTRDVANTRAYFAQAPA